MRKACNELSIGCETGLILKIAQRVGDSFCHSCCGQLLVKYLIVMRLTKRQRCARKYMTCKAHQPPSSD